jgi:hypothetical protein
MITTIKELVEDHCHEIDPSLFKNLIILSHAIDGNVTITGFADGKLQSENTQKGVNLVVESALAGMREEVAFKVVAQSKSYLARKARYEHDCPKCVFLGRWGATDLYFCGEHRAPTVISRRSDEPSDYVSGLNSTMSELREAQRRAIDMELLDPA